MAVCGAIAIIAQSSAMVITDMRWQQGWCVACGGSQSECTATKKAGLEGMRRPGRTAHDTA